MINKTRGFTLIELITAIVVVAILAAVALPSYRAHIMRAKIAEATSTLADMRVKMEQYFQDQRSYVGACAPNTVAPLPTGRNFTYTCPTLTATAFTVTATGNAAQGMDGFVYTVNQNNAQATTITGAAATAGFASNANCWVTKKGTGPAAC